MHTSVVVLVETKASESPEAGVTDMWVRGTELESFARAQCSLSCRVTSPGPSLSLELGTELGNCSNYL